MRDNKIPSDHEMTAIADVSVRSRTDINESINTFCRLSALMEEARALRITETLNKMFVICGTPPSERAETILHLAHALAVGNLRGGDLQAIREFTPLLSQALADEVGTVPGGLRRLGDEGAITAEVIFVVLDSVKPTIDAMFSKKPMTMAESYAYHKAIEVLHQLKARKVIG